MNTKRKNIYFENRFGFISPYFLVFFALALGFAGGFLIQQPPFFSSASVNRVSSAGFLENTYSSSTETQKTSLLGSVSEIFDRAFGKSVNHLSAEVVLGDGSFSSSEFKSSKNVFSEESLSSTTLPKEKVIEKKPEEIFSCASSSIDASNREIIFNELAWMGSVPESGETSAVASRREWIELLNISSRTISLANWEIKDGEGKFKIIFPNGASLKGNSFYLLSRSGGEKIMGKKPDLIYNASLSNDGEKLKLINSRCEVVDSIDASGKWLAGNRETKQTMERDGDRLGWHTSLSPGGTPKFENSVIKTSATAPVISGGGSSVSIAASSAAPPPPAAYSKLIITEIMTTSASSTHDEFVELYNPGSSSVDLTGWYMQKETKSAASLQTFLTKSDLSGKSVGSHSFFLVFHPSSSFSGDVSTDEGLADDNTVVLKNPNGEIVDKVGWGAAGDFEGLAAVGIDSGKSIQRKFMSDNFIDTDNNGNDFELKDCPSPKSFLNVCSELAVLIESSSELEAVTDTGTLTLATSSLNETSTENSFIISDNTTSTTTTTEEVVITATSSDQSASSSESSLDHLVIAEIQITGGSGKTDNDFIKIFNPTSNPVDISGWKLRKRTQSGSETSIKVFPDESVIASNRSFLWVNSKDGFSETVGAHVSSTQTLASDNSVALLNASGVVIDAVAWGSGHTNPFIEGSAFPENPDGGKILHRKIIEGAYQDIGDNSSDFELTSI